ncbi:Na(+)/H(+) exchange regulatory cofactor NHE-RF2 isoform X2 [Channa argus]|uniref:Na(+)/H(+) exchange regulatory cofactor NHE-RF2 isoform X2 n=1 Tax=Channa argus TaxID=215402 RepID=UPI003522B52A
MENEMRPRLCFLTKGEDGYGFHLHGERNKGGQFVRKVEPGSSADLAGLRPGDRVVEVNGENVENETHHQVVSRICAVPNRTRILVVDRDTDEYLRSRGLACTEDLAIEMGTLSPRPSSRLTSTTFPITTVGSNMLLKPSNTYSFHPCAAESPTCTTGQDKVKRTSVTSSTATDTKVNGVNIEGLKHSDVVGLIRAGGEEARLLVVDQETDELFHRLGITPSTSNVKEVYVDNSATEPVPPTPPPTTEILDTDPPMINVTLTESPVFHMSSKSRTNGSSASQSSRSSATPSDVSSSDMSIQVPDEDDRRVSDPAIDSGLRLSPTAAEAKQKASARRNKKRAPPMDWNKRHEIFSNF